MKCYLLVWAFTAAEVLMLQAAVPASMPRAVHACGRCAAGASVVQIHVCVLPWFGLVWFGLELAAITYAEAHLPSFSSGENL